MPEKFLMHKISTMKKFWIITIVLTAIVLNAKAQDSIGTEQEKKGFDKSKLFIGGNFGLSFGDYTLINISPQAGYRFNRYFAAGMGINGQYTQINYRDGNNETYARQNYGVAGVNIFGRAYPIQQVFVQAQPELNYIWGSTTEYASPEDIKSSLNGKILPSLLLGAGGVLPLGGVGGFIIMVQYDVLNKSSYSSSSDPGTPYGNKPFISIGVNFGL
jgi:hypothetical protein